MIRALLTAVFAALLSTGAFAHSQSYGYLNVNAETSGGQLQLAVRDADLLYALDENGDGSITWGEVMAREPEIATAMLAGISMKRGGSACALSPAPMMVDNHGGETYLAVPFTGACTGTGDLAIGYTLLFTRDAQHRGIVAVSEGGATQTVIMSPDLQSTVISAEGGLVSRFATFVAHGAHHIWIGYDHILFLVTLLLATVLGTRGLGLRRSLVEATKVVTAFTVSHSVTLGLAATGLVNVPSAATESLIALTIALAAANNIWPVINTRVWAMALVFGLVHGLGFANVLADLGLPRESLLVSLLAFNIGVELGQLVIVAVALPLIHLLAAPKLGWKSLPVANALIIALGLAWFSDRALGTALMPF